MVHIEMNAATGHSNEWQENERELERPGFVGKCRGEKRD
jgi:hypothetical protein